MDRDLWLVSLFLICVAAGMALGGLSTKALFFRAGSQPVSTSGACGPDPLPSYLTAAFPIAASLLTCETLWDDFTNINTVDVNNTRLPGFKWYRYNGWNDENGFHPDTPLPATYAITSDGISITNIGTSGSDVNYQRFKLLDNCGLDTSGNLIAGATVLSGRSNFVEIKFANTHEDGDAGGGLAYYGSNDNTVIPTYPLTLDHLPELDYMNNEDGACAPGMSYFDWFIRYSGVAAGPIGISGVGGGCVSNSSWSTLTLNSTDNGGTGVIAGFHNGVHGTGPDLLWRPPITPGFTVTGSISGTTLTTTTTPTNTILPGARLTGTGINDAPTFVVSQIDATDYTVNVSQTVASTTLTGAYGTFSGSVYPMCLHWEIPFSSAPISPAFTMRSFRHWTTGPGNPH